MNTSKCDKASRWHIFIRVLGITALVLLMLVSSTGCVSFAGIPNTNSNSVSNLNKAIENDIKIQDKAIEINPQNSTAWNNTGVDLNKLNKFDEAIIAYNKAIEINPQNAYAWGGKGYALSKLNKSDEAIKAYEKAIEINPQLRSLAQ